MARTLEAVSIGKLEDLLQCSICFGTVKDPRTLPCFHSYCKACLDRFIKNHREKAVGRQIKDFDCPNCRSQFTLNPGEEVTDMKPNHFICNMLEVTAVQNRLKVVSCSHCQEPSVGRCVDCEVFLCQECLAGHKNYRGFAEHSVLSMDELSKPENQAKIRKKLHCREHKKKTLKFYCETCEELICRDCTDFSHEKPEHSWLPVEKVAEKQKQLLDESCTALENKLKQGNQALRKVTDVTQSLAKVKERVKLDINARRDTVLKAVTRQLNEKAQDLINQVDGIYSRKHDSLAKQEVEFQAYVEKVESCVNISKEMLTRGTDEEILSSAKMMKEKIEKVQKEIPKTMEPNCDDEICYECGPMNTVTVDKVCAEMGKVEDRNQTILNKMVRISGDNNSNDKDNISSSVTKVEINDTGLTAEPFAFFAKSTDDKSGMASESSISPNVTTGNNADKMSSGKPENDVYGRIRNKQLSCNLSKKMKLLVYQGDITEEKVDAIINPANEDLHHVGGTAFAIAKQGGESIQNESDDIMKRRKQQLKPGEVEVTTAGDLPCNFIVHAVGPRWAYCSSSETRKLLRNAVLNSLRIASQNKAQSIAIPAISSGVFGVPIKLCAEVLFTTVDEFSKAAADSENLKEIRFVNTDETTVEAFKQEMRKRYNCASVKNESHENDVSNENRMNTSMAKNQNQASYQQHFGPENLKKETRNAGRTSQQIKVSDNGKLIYSKRTREIPNSQTSTQEGDQTNHPFSYFKAVTNNLGKPIDDKSNTDTSECPICLDEMKNPKTLNKCNHTFCTTCIDNTFKHQKKCPICSEVYGQLTGNQPPGQMSTRRLPSSLRGYENCGTIIIDYQFNNGKQGPNHPNPGRPYTGTSRHGYLPDNDEGRKVRSLLRKAFDQKLTFTIGRSSTTGVENAVVWNDIHHKTNTFGGSINYGYPDPTYLTRVKEELAAKGIKE